MEQIDSRDSAKRLHIIGIIHRDTRNGRCINRHLNMISPDTVTLEFSSYGLQFRKEHGSRYIQQLESVRKRIQNEGTAINEDALFQLRAYISLPSEYDAARAYCSATSARLHLVDMNRYSRRKLKSSEELFSEKNIREVAALPHDNLQKAERIMAELFFYSDVKTITYSDEMCVRDRYMSRRIKALFDQSHCRHIAHITGWRHLKDPHGLFTPLYPTKVYAYD